MRKLTLLLLLLVLTAWPVYSQFGGNNFISVVDTTRTAKVGIIYFSKADSNYYVGGSDGFYKFLCTSQDYGFRDNAGTMEYKNEDGAWAGVASAGSGGGTVDDGTIVRAETGTDDFAWGGTTIAASVFGIDESTSSYYYGYDNSANPKHYWEATDGDAGQMEFTTNDQWKWSGADHNFSRQYAVALQNVPDLVAGVGKTAYWFDEVNDYVNIGDDANIDFGTGNFSLEIHFRPNNVTDANQFLMNKEAGGVGYGLEMRTDDLWIRIDDNTADATALIGTAVFSTNTWVHVVVTFDRDGNAVAYVNGNLTGTTVDISGSPLTLSSAGDLRIATETGGATKPFGGSISLARPWSCILTAAEVKALSSGAPVPYKYTGANQTELVTGDDFDFDTDTGNWLDVGSAVFSVVGNEGVITLPTAGGSHGVRINANVIDGKQYSVSVSMKISAATEVIGISVNLGETNSIHKMSISPTTSAVTYTGSFIAKNTTYVTIWAYLTNGEVITIDDFSIRQTGCVAQYEPSGIDDGKWYDASGSNLDGTVSGAVVVNPPTNVYIDNEEPSANEIIENIGKTVSGSRTDLRTLDEDGDQVLAGNSAAATYGSDASISDAELLTLDNGTTSQYLVGGGAGSAPVWTEAGGLQSIDGLIEADVSIIEAIANNNYNVVTSGGNNYILGSNAGNTALEFKAPTGSGAPVLAISPALTGTATAENITLSGELVETPGGDDTISDAGTIDVTGHAYLRVVSDDADATDVSLEDGTADGQRLLLQGTNDSNLVTITDGNNCQLAGGGNFSLGIGDIIELIWDSGASDWYEISRSDN